MFYPFFESSERRRTRKKRESEYAEEVLKKAVPWDPQMKWLPTLGIEARSFQTWLNARMLFPDVRPSKLTTHIKNVDDKIVSPCGQFAYVNRIFPGAESLPSYYGNKKGNVWFTEDVVVPTLVRIWKGWADGDSVAMSLTPMEIFTLRGGTRRAKGHVVVAGLGLGYQLREVAARKSVKKITLVERSNGLLQWLLPPVLEKMEGVKDITVIEGDAREIVPKLQADIALIDIADGYGHNEFRRCPDIPYVWVWGSAKISDGSLW
jgi:hypothetical protein